MAPLFAIIRYALLETFFCIPILPKTVRANEAGCYNKKRASADTHRVSTEAHNIYALWYMVENRLLCGYIAARLYGWENIHGYLLA